MLAKASEIDRGLIEKSLRALMVSSWDFARSRLMLSASILPPELVISYRLTRTLGYYDIGTANITLSAKMYCKNPHLYASDIILHEMAHYLDFKVNGWYDRKPHHGPQWQEIMQALGLEATASYHVD